MDGTGGTLRTIQALQGVEIGAATPSISVGASPFGPFHNLVLSERVCRVPAKA
jgi:hypothetical protein